MKDKHSNLVVSMVEFQIQHFRLSNGSEYGNLDFRISRLRVSMFNFGSAKVAGHVFCF